MKTSRHLFFGTAVLCLALIISCSKSSTDSGSGPSANATLNASLISFSSAPDVNSSTIEAIWANASALTINASKVGQNFSGPDRTFPITVKSLVSDNDIYFLVQYDDPTEDYLEQPVAFTGGDPRDPTKWQLLSSVYGDGVSFFFETVPGKSGSLTFPANGCSMLCHTTSTASWSPGMFAEDTGQYDVWYWHSGKSNGCGYADDDISLGVPNYDLEKDAASDENYQNNTFDYPNGHSTPARVAGGNNQQLNKSNFVAYETSVAWTGSEKNPATGAPWAVGDRVAGYTIANPTPLSSDYFDVQSRGYYAGGKWNVKFHRKLNTGAEHLDVVFQHGKSYLFSVAVNDATKPGNHYGDANTAFKLVIP